MVSSRRTDLLEIPGFGLAQAVAPDAPARFELLAEQRGSYPILQAEEDCLAARIQVEPAGKPSGDRAARRKQAKGSGAKPGGC